MEQKVFDREDFEPLELSRALRATPESSRTGDFNGELGASGTHFS